MYRHPRRGTNSPQTVFPPAVIHVTYEAQLLGEVLRPVNVGYRYQDHLECHPHRELLFDVGIRAAPTACRPAAALLTNRAHLWCSRRRYCC